MFKLSVFAYIFLVLLVLIFIVVCVKERRFTATVLISAIITLSISVGVGVIIADYARGTQTAVTTIKINHNNIHSWRKHFGLFMRFSDRDNNQYWGVGGMEQIHYSGSVDVLVRITYLPKTRFVLGIEKYVADIPQIPLLGIKESKKEYRQIYSNGYCWAVGCVFLLAILVGALCIEEGKKK